MTWTKEEDALLAECVGRGLDSVGAAQALNAALGSRRTPPAVRGRWRRLGLVLGGTVVYRGDNPLVSWDKKESSADWRELGQWVAKGQEIRKGASCSQDAARISIQPEGDEIAICVLGDLHWGSWGTDYTLIEKITDELLSIDGLYALLVGDLEQQAIKMRNVLEMSDNALTPELQAKFTESWLEEVGHKIVAACWDNHSVMRQEAAAGQSEFKRALGERVVYFNGIGHIDLSVGKEAYKIAISHFFRGRSIHNPCYAQRVYMQTVGQDREIAIAGDSHEPGILEYCNGNTRRLAVNCGTAQVNSGYAKRFFSLHSMPVFPIIVLSAKAHTWRTFWNLQDYVEYRSKAPAKE